MVIRVTKRIAHQWRVQSQVLNNPQIVTAVIIIIITTTIIIIATITTVTITMDTVMIQTAVAMVTPPLGPHPIVPVM